MRPEVVVAEYFRCIRENDSHAIAEFFAPDAVKIDWQGETYSGTAELVAYMESYVFQQNFAWHLGDGSVVGPDRPDDPITHLTPLPPMSTEIRSGVEVNVERPDGSRYRSIDMFKLNNEGRVCELLVYRGPYAPA